MRHFACILTILMCVAIYSSTSNASTPTKPKRPDKTAFDNARDHYQAWWDQTIPEAKKDVDDAFNAAMNLVNDFKNANAAMRNTMYKGLPAGIKTNIVSALSSALGISVEIATNRAKAMTLAGAASAVFGNHKTTLIIFDDYWDGGGLVTQASILENIQAEINQNSVPGVQAYSLMGAFHRMEYAGGVYNLEVQDWNAWHKKYAPSQYDVEKRGEVTIQDPLKPTFTQIGCFNHCGDFFDTFSSAESSHKKECGTASNIESVATPPRRLEIRRSRSVSQGCGRDYYHCQNKPNTQHEPQTCSTSGCSVKYRNCLPHTKPHSNHGGSGSSASLSPSGGSYTASAGSTHTANVSVPSGYQYVYWYIAGPGIDGLGLLQETDSGYGTSTTASFSWSIPSYTSGNHVITAYTQLSDNSIVQPSYTVTVGSSSSTDTTDTTTTDTTTSTDTSSTTDDDDDDDTAESSDGNTNSNMAVCTRIVKKKRWEYIGQRRGRPHYDWVYYWEACGETFYIYGSDWCRGAYDGNRSYRHSAD